MDTFSRTKSTTRPRSTISLKSCAIVLTFTFIAYAHTLSFSFVYDDVFHLVGDTRLESWDHWPGFFTEHLWSPLFDEGSYYRPIILTWFLIQKTFFATNATLWHLASVTLHVFATALVHRIAYRILKDPFPAAVAALAFGLHPVHIESVAWISGSVDPLMAIFVLAAYLGFLTWQDVDPSDRKLNALWLTISLVCYVLAQLTKETAIVLPAIIFCSAYIISRKANATVISKLVDAIRAALPYLMCAGLYFAVRFVVLGRFLGNTAAVSVSDFLFTLPGVVFQYTQHLIFPVELSPLYDTPFVTTFSWASVGLPLALIVLAGAGLTYWARFSNVVLLAVVWMILPLLPVLNFALLPDPDRFHDRFLYLPSVGFALLIGLGISGLKSTGLRAFGVPVARFCVAILICAPLAVGTASQSVYWKDDLQLFSRAAEIAPGNNAALNNLGKELIKSARLEEAEVYLQKVIERAPEHAYALLNLGRLNFIRRDYKQAEEYLLRALTFDGSNPDIYINLGFVHARMGRLGVAEEDFRRAMVYSRNRPGYGNALGVLLRNQGRLSEALTVFEQELTLDPTQEDVKKQVEQLRARIPGP